MSDDIYGKCKQCGGNLTNGHICSDKLGEIMHKSLEKSSTLVGIGVPVAFQKMTKSRKEMIELIEKLDKTIIDCYETRHVKYADMFVECRDALIEPSIEAKYAGVVKRLEQLVNLKEYKDRFGKTETYLDLQPKAWDDAREALKELD